ncbi:hypothetical protein J3F84DRAFT_381838 [Trichoderma pleuroticola]
MRCTSSGFPCDGYRITTKSSSNPSPAPQLRWMMIHVQNHDVPLVARSIQFFTEQTIQQLSMFFPDEFWSTRVLQLAYSESCIWHALVALSTYHERYIDRSPGGDALFALRHYNLAINSLSSVRHDLSLIHLVSCIIFICIEILRGHIRSAIRLYTSGCRMMREIQPTISNRDHLFHLIEAFFNRLTLQILWIFGNSRQGLLDMSYAVPESKKSSPPQFAFQQLSEAREAIHGIALQWMLDGPAGQEALGALVNRFGEWCRAFDTFQQENSQSLASATNRRALTLLELQKRYLATHLSTIDSRGVDDETVWDGYSGQFNEMLDFAETSMQIYDSEATSNKHPRFHMDTGVIPILFAIITRCRDPFIRRRAIELMTWNPMQEGLWNSALVAKAAQRLMSLEEGTVIVGCSNDIPAAARVQGISVYAGDERRVVLRFSQPLGSWQESMNY